MKFGVDWTKGIGDIALYTKLPQNVSTKQLHIVGRIPVKFQKNWLKTVGEEVHTKFVPYIFYTKTKKKRIDTIWHFVLHDHPK